MRKWIRRIQSTIGQKLSWAARLEMICMAQYERKGKLDRVASRVRKEQACNGPISTSTSSELRHLDYHRAYRDRALLS